MSLERIETDWRVSVDDFDKRTVVSLSGGGLYRQAVKSSRK